MIEKPVREIPHAGLGFWNEAGMSKAKDKRTNERMNSSRGRDKMIFEADRRFPF